MAGGWDLCVEIICIAFDENHKELMNCSREQKSDREGERGDSAGCRDQLGCGLNNWMV